MKLLLSTFRVSNAGRLPRLDGMVPVRSKKGVTEAVNEVSCALESHVHHPKPTLEIIR